MTISQRAAVHDVVCDVVCTGRFYDFLEKRGGRWGIVLRQPIYEKDRLDPVDPAARLELDGAVLARFPLGYRHLAYAQTAIGYEVKPDMPGLTGAEVRAPLRAGRELAGRQAAPLDLGSSSHDREPTELRRRAAGKARGGAGRRPLPDLLGRVGSAGDPARWAASVRC